MKLKFFLLIAFILNMHFIFSNDYHIYQEEKLVTFKMGTDLAYQITLDTFLSEGPAAIGFDKDGKLHINDSHNERIVVYNNLLKQERIISYKDFSEFAGVIQLYFDNDTISGNSTGVFIGKISKTGKAIYRFNLAMGFPPQEIQNDNFIIINNNVFYRLYNDGFVLYPNLDTDYQNNLKKMVNSETVYNLFKADSKMDKKQYNINNLVIENDRLILDKKLITRDYKTFVEYWKEKHQGMEDKNNYRVIPAGVNFTKFGDMTYYDNDAAGNIYFADSDQSMVIFDKDGWLIESYVLNRDGYQLISAIHPSGDVYNFGYDKTEATLYRIKNVWDAAGRAAWYENRKDFTPPKPLTAKITDNSVRLRDQPNLNGNFIIYLNKTDTVEILDQTKEKMKIDKMEAVWYKVKTKDGKEGWVYGYFVALNQ